MKIIPPAIYLNGNDELLHKAMVLVGDPKAFALERLRKLDKGYKGQLQGVINYIVTLYNHIEEDDISAWKRHVDSIKTVRCPIRVDALVYAPLYILIGDRPLGSRNPNYIPITDKRFGPAEQSVLYGLAPTTITYDEVGS